MKKLALILTIANLWAMAMELPQKEELQKIPAGIPNVSAPGIRGTCINNARLQIIAAGLQRFFPKANDLKKLLENEQKLLSTIERYRESSDKNKLFLFEIDEIQNDSVWSPWPKGLLPIMHVLFPFYFSKDGKEEQKSLPIDPNNPKNTVTGIHLNIDKDNEQFFRSFMPNLDLQNKQLFIAHCGSQSALDLSYIENTSKLKNLKSPQIPTEFIAKNGNHYRLIGMVFQHNYAAIGKELEEKGLIIQNRKIRFWLKHFDSFVCYGKTWYLIDDETRYKVSANYTDDNTNNNNSTSHTISSPTTTAQAIMNCYPGILCIGMYALNPENNNGTSQETPLPENSKKFAIELSNDTNKIHNSSKAIIYTSQSRNKHCGIRDQEYYSAYGVNNNNSDIESVTVHCDYCKNPESNEKKLMICSQCKKAQYCNQDCQKKDWRNHKPVCKKPNCNN